jgi:hypothetical protein
MIPFVGFLRRGRFRPAREVPALEVLEDRVQPSVTGPIGIFSSGGPTTGFGEGSVTAAVAAKDFVTGFLVRIDWHLVEPADGAFDWHLLDDQVARAAGYGKLVTLAVVNGGGAPDWLYAEGVQSFTFDFHGMQTRIPVPWDPIYLSKWTELIQQFGARYDGNPDVALVHVTNSTANGFEMQLPGSPRDWIPLGYTPQRMIDSWTQVIDAFAAAFPSTNLDVELHPVLGSDEVPAALMTYAWNNYGQQFGAFAAWWSQHNTTVYPGPWQLLQQGVGQSFSTVQFVTNATHDPNGFGDGGIQGAIDLAFDTGISYMEPWDVDLLNPAFESMFEDLAMRLNGGGAPRFPPPGGQPGHGDDSASIESAELIPAALVEVAGGNAIPTRNAKLAAVVPETRLEGSQTIGGEQPTTATRQADARGRGFRDALPDERDADMDPALIAPGDTGDSEANHSGAGHRTP